STITIDNLATGVISVSGNVAALTPNGYQDIANSANGANAVAIAAAGKTITINNAGKIQGGAGTDYSQGPAANAQFENLNLPDRYLAGAIQTGGDTSEINGVETYIASKDTVNNLATGEITCSIDLGGNDDK